MTDMKINFVQNAGANCNINKSAPQKHYCQIHSNICDSVSFGANNIKGELSPLEQHGVSVAKKLMKMQRSGDLNRENISKYLNSISPVPVYVDHISNLPPQIRANMPNAVAHMVPGYNFQNVELAMANIYLKDAGNAKEAGDLIANTAHEFTHVLQRHADKGYYGIKQYTRDSAEITSLARASQQMYNSLINTCARILMYDDEFQAKLRKGRIPDSTEIEKCLMKNGRKDTFAQSVEHTVKELSKRGALPPVKMDVDTIIKIAKGWIAKEAQNETEAYNVTLSALRQWGKYEPDVLLNRSVTRSINQIIANLF